MCKCRRILILSLTLVLAPAIVRAASCEELLAHGPSQWQLRFQSLVGKPVVTERVGSSSTAQSPDGHMEYIAYGIPSFAKLRKVQQDEVFRHYSPPESLEVIKKNSKLVAGNLSYVIKGGGIKTSYIDITGIFLTRPRFSPESVGVAKDLKNSFIDLKLAAGTEILELEPGIAVIPGPPRVPAWLTAYAPAFRSAPQSVPAYVRPALQRLDNQGLLDMQPLEIPIEILR